MVFVLCLIPFFILIILTILNKLGSNPIEYATHNTGDWALRFLLITLALTPLRKIFKLNSLVHFRRLFGLYAFFYASVHFFIYIGIDQFFSFSEILKDVLKRKYITVGFSAFVLLIPLAITSTNAMMKRLKKKWWTLHKLIYFIGILAVVHYIWLVKADLFLPLMYSSILMVLLLYRLYDKIKNNREHSLRHKNLKNKPE